MKKLLPVLYVVLGFCAYVAYICIFDIPCPIKYLTGFSCLGCGMTRAYMSALSLDFRQAFCYHPLWCTLPVMAVLLLSFHLRKNKKAFCITLCTCIALFILVYVYRIATHPPILSFDYRQGEIYVRLSRLIEYFK